MGLLDGDGLSNYGISLLFIHQRNLISVLLYFIINFTVSMGSFKGMGN